MREISGLVEQLQHIALKPFFDDSVKPLASRSGDISGDPTQPDLLKIIKGQLETLQKDVSAQLDSREFGEIMRQLDTELTEGLKEIEQLEHPGDDIRSVGPAR